jgi:hypothetical protein
MMGVTPMLLFILSFLLFVMLLIPNMGQKLLEKLDISSSGHREYRVLGTVWEQVRREKNVIDTKPLPAVVVEIGGFSTFTDTAGRFELKFRSMNSKDIPIIFRLGTKERIDRITFGTGNSTIQMGFVFR